MLAKLIVLLLVVVFLVAAFAYVRGGRLTEVYRTSSQISHLQADPHGLCWLEGPRDTPADRVCALDGGLAPVRRVFQQPNLVSLAICEEALVVLRRDGETGAVVAAPRSGGTPSTIAEGLLRPVGLGIVGSEVFWTEIFPGKVPPARHIPATEPRLVLRAVDLKGGAPRTVACLRGGAELRGEILGGHEGQIYLIDITAQDCGQGWSNLRRVPLNGRIADTPIRERGLQTGRLVGSMLWWTAPSDDAGNPTYARALRRAKLPGLESETVTDWLPAGGRLLDLAGRLYYASVQGVWAIPHERGLPRVVTKEVVASDLAVGFEGALYQVRGEGQTQVLYRRACTIGERIQAGLGIK